jgi:hypothetical protein
LSTSIKCDKSTNRQQTDGQTGTSRLRDHHLCAHRYEPSPNPCLAMFLFCAFFSRHLSMPVAIAADAASVSGIRQRQAPLQGHSGSSLFARPRTRVVHFSRSHGWPASSVRPPRGRCLRGCARGSSAPYCILSEARIHLHEHSQSASSPGRGAPSAARAAVASGALRRSSECATGAAWHGTAPR